LVQGDVHIPQASKHGLQNCIYVKPYCDGFCVLPEQGFPEPALCKNLPLPDLSAGMKPAIAWNRLATALSQPERCEPASRQQKWKENIPS
jgi:hypothetical protein